MFKKVMCCKEVMCLVSFVLVFGLVGVADAELITGVTTSASGEYTGGREAFHAVDGSNLNFIGSPGEENDPSKYTHTGGNNHFGQGGVMWLVGRGVPPDDMWFAVDLGAIYPVRFLNFFNFGVSTGARNNRGIQQADIYYRTDSLGNNSHDNVTAFDPAGWTLFGTAGTQTFTMGPTNGDTQGPDTIDLRGIKARFIAFDINSNYGGGTFAGIGEVQFFSGRAGQASLRTPANGATDVLRDGVVLSWTPGDFADKHDVYIGTGFDDVNDATATVDPAGVYVGLQSETAVALDRLEFGQTTYWRVDEVNAPPDLTVFKGDVWSFTVEPIGYPISNVVATADGSFEESVAERTVDGSGLTDDLHGTTVGDMWMSTGIPATIQFDFDRVHKLHEMLIWNSNQTVESFVGFGAKDVVIEHSLDGENWTALEGVGPLAQAPGKVGYAANNQIAFGGATAQHVRLIINSAQGPSPQVSLSEVRFLSIPTLATGPDPESGAAGVAPDVTLSWGRDGREAELHDVYVGSDPDALALAGSIADSSFATAALDLQLGQTYSWRVDEVNNAMDPSIWTGDLWSFTTTDVVVVDDMEAYKDEEFKEIWVTWTDGFDDPANGALVGANPAGGDFSPETGIVNGGRQSLPIHFDNTGAPVSETTRTFDQAQDWTRFGITTLSLFVFAGDDNTGGDLYIKINDEKIALVDKSTYPAGLNPGWVRYNIDLTTRDVSSVSSLTMGVEGAGAQGVIYVDDIELYAQAPDLMILSFLAPTIEAESGTLSAPFEILSDRPEASGGQYIIVPNASGNSNGDPAARDDGWAVYTLNIPADGDYVIAFLGAELDSDSFWVNIPGMIVNDDSLDNSGWLRSNAIFNSSEFVWDFVRDDVGATTDPVVFTLTAGQHELQISRREDGTALDAIAIFSVN